MGIQRARSESHDCQFRRVAHLTASRRRLRSSLLKIQLAPKGHGLFFKRPKSLPKIPVSIYATGWTAAMRRGPKVVCETPEVPGIDPECATVVVKDDSLAHSIKITSCEFAVQQTVKLQLPAKSVEPTGSSADTVSSKSPPSRKKLPATRIRPPGDTVRLEDRLFYLLQPPIETWLGNESLNFAFEPFPYQYAGVAFLYPRYAAILADEMGLGKTMQAITAIRLLLRTGEVGSVLLVCPKPLLTNWRREFELWAPEIPVAIIEGAADKRDWQWGLDSVPVKIANYELMVRDKERLVDGAEKFDLVVLDEAQRIKNRSGATSEVIRSIERKRSWALTGTPVENSADDLYGIFEFLAPGYLNSSMTPRRMGKAACDYILRRTKDLVLDDLPPKMFCDPMLNLTAAQQEAYDLAETQGVIRLTEMGDAATIQHVFELVLRLKQICNFDHATGASAKYDRLSADLEEVAASGKKAIVFSQWVDTLKNLSSRLKADGHSPLEYHGKVASSRRDSILDQFKNDPTSNVILMSYGAGSVGLNLQFASYVFLFDRWWNPAVEDQAINRAHRIGAVGPVTVTRFIMAGTIEERIDEVLQGKRELFETILAYAHGSEAPKSGLSESEIFGLFSLRTPKRHAA